jgi:hypothetical protein
MDVTANHIDLEDWIGVNDFPPVSNAFIYKLLKKYPDDLITVLVGVTGSGGKRLISKKSLEALLMKLSAQQAADKDAREKRSLIFHNKRNGIKGGCAN